MTGFGYRVALKSPAVSSEVVSRLLSYILSIHLIPVVGHVNLWMNLNEGLSREIVSLAMAVRQRQTTWHAL